MQGSWQCPNCRVLYFTKKGGLFKKVKRIQIHVFPNGFTCCVKCYNNGKEWAINFAVKEKEE